MQVQSKRFIFLNFFFWSISKVTLTVEDEEVSRPLIGQKKIMRKLFDLRRIVFFFFFLVV